MFYLALTIGFGLRIDQTAHTLHGSCSRTFVGFGAMLGTNSMCRVGVGL